MHLTCYITLLGERLIMKLSELITADQALEIIEMLEDLTKRIENLENAQK